MVEEERRSKAYAKILNQASTYQQVRHLPAGQTPTGRTDTYQQVRFIPAGQTPTTKSVTYQQVSHQPAGQPPTSRSATYQQVRDCVVMTIVINVTLQTYFSV